MVLIDSLDIVVTCLECGWKGPVVQMKSKDFGFGMSGDFCPTCDKKLVASDMDDSFLVEKNAVIS